MKDGTTHLAYKPEHAVDLDTGAVVAAEIHPADEGDTTTPEGTLKAAAANLAKVDRALSMTERAELVAKKGYHSRAVLKDLDGGAWKDPDRRTAAHGGPALARRYRGAGRRLRHQTQSPALRCRQGSDATPRRPPSDLQSGARRHAARALS
jgi:hypothetical protein